MKKLSVLFFTLILFNVSYSQESPILSFHGIAGFSKDEFESAYPNFASVGLDVSLLLSPEYNSPFYFGFELGYMNYEHFSEPRTVYYEGDSYSGKFIRNHNIFQFHAVTRINVLPEAKVKPYIDFKLGMKKFYTRTKETFKYYDSSLDENEKKTINGGTILHDTTYSFGGTLGFSINVGSGQYLDLNVTHTLGGEVDYLQPSDISNSSIVNNISRSNTNMLLFRIGYSIEIN